MEKTTQSLVSQDRCLEREIINEAGRRGFFDNSLDTILTAETHAAEWSLSSGLYVSFQPSGFSSIPASACDDIRNGTSQCCRVGRQSLCECGHSLEAHENCKIPKRPGYIKPPKCLSCKRCPSFNYLPMYTEECGQWWLKRRRDFNLHDWRKVNSKIKSFQML